MPRPESVVLVPYKTGDESKLGPVVQNDYFGRVPDDRLKVLPEAVLFRADGQYRSKIGTSQQRAERPRRIDRFSHGSADGGEIQSAREAGG